MKRTNVHNIDDLEKSQVIPTKILLLVMPFWDPLIPPMGISCLHSFLKKHCAAVRKVDTNVENLFMDGYESYFTRLKQYIPIDKRSNFFNIGKEVLRNHMMAHINYSSEDEYIRLVQILVAKTFFCEIDRNQVVELSKILEDFYAHLKIFLLKLFDEVKPEVVGISVFKGSLPASLFAFRLAKEYDPQVKTVMGGGIFADQLTPGSPDWDLFLEKTPFIDKIIIGEGELLFLKYLRNELPDNQKTFTLEDIDNKILDLSRVDIPDFSDFDLEYYPYLAAYTSRSCPFQCRFCSETVLWGKYRKKEPQQVVAELSKLFEKYGNQLYLMSDSLLNPIITSLAKEFIETDVSLYWDGYLRVDNYVCKPENTLLWRRGGFYRARLGVESGSKRVLDLMHKGITLTQIKESVKSLAYAGIKTTTYWIIGYPGETEEDFQQTIELLEELKNDIYEAEFNAFWYYESGQVNSKEWSKKSTPLYPETARDMLILQTKSLDYPPSRKETYNRLALITELSSKLGIPNPYSLYDIYRADERWEKLHTNAVPSLLKLKDKNQYIDECKYVKDIFIAQDIQPLEGEWDFEEHGDEEIENENEGKIYF